MALLTVEVDGKPVQVPHGATVMEAANKLGIFVPHFCYHKKLSIAANCRMCLVQVEKAPKPMPACATPVTDGMKVWTHSEAAKKAQNGVMEFLLINHPLDCPICDQGGECQLQDLAVGYGDSASRYVEPKRVVFKKNLGPLISAEEMSRCIHCTRCVRFGQEVAGIMELGMVGRGEHSEIVSFVGNTVDSELSGNMIDLCPVGALTSKPFRYSARTWELNRRKSVSPHDSLGSNLIVQVKLNTVKRVVPLENEAINECWISDRDRFSYEGLNSDDRLTRPMIKQDGEWKEVDWQTALERVAAGLRSAQASAGGAGLGALISPQSTVEEMHLARKLWQGLGSDNIDFRLRQADFSLDGRRKGAPWLGMSIAEVSALDRVLIVGSFLRQDHPLLAARFRSAAKRGQQISILHCSDDELLMNVAARAIVPPAILPETLGQIVKAVAEAGKLPVPAGVAALQVSEAARAVAAKLTGGKSAAVFLGNLAEQHPRAAQLLVLAQTLADMLGGRFGVLGQAANSAGGHLVRCLPVNGGLAAAGMLQTPRKAYMLFGVEPDLDCANPVLAKAALAAADFVVAVSAYRGRLAECADVLLPMTPFTETPGTFVNCEGRAQSFNAVVRPLGEARPGWKILRVMGNLMGVAGFEFEQSEAVRSEALGEPDDLQGRLDNRVEAVELHLGDAAGGHLQRLSDVPTYFADPIVRRAEALQQTRAARAPKACIPSHLARHFGLAAGDRVRVRQDGDAVLEVAIDDRLPAGVVRIAAAHASTAGLGAMFGDLTMEKV